MWFNILICIFLPKNYNFLIFYHVNSSLQFNFNSINIYGNRCFPNFNISLHSLLNIPIWSQCNHMYRRCFPNLNINLHSLLYIPIWSQCNRIFHLLSNHPNLYISFFRDTSNATCKLSSGLLISYTISHFHSNVHLTKSPKCPK